LFATSKKAKRLFSNIDLRISILMKEENSEILMDRWIDKIF